MGGSSAFLGGLTVGAIVAGAIAAAGAVLAVLFLPAQPASSGPGADRTTLVTLVTVLAATGADQEGLRTRLRHAPLETRYSFQEPSDVGRC
jgi:hypothetical protein